MCNGTPKNARKGLMSFPSGHSSWTASGQLHDSVHTHPVTIIIAHKEISGI